MSVKHTKLTCTLHESAALITPKMTEMQTLRPEPGRICIYVCMYMSSLVAPLVENLPTTQETTCQCKRCGNSPWVRKSPWRWKWLPTPVFLPGKSQRQRILEGYRPWGLKSSIKLIYIYSSNLMTHCNKWEGLATLEHSLL